MIQQLLLHSNVRECYICESLSLGIGGVVADECSWHFKEYCRSPLHAPQMILSSCITFGHGHFVQLNRPFQVAFDSEPIFIHDAQVRMGTGVIELDGPSPVHDRCRVIFK